VRAFPAMPDPPWQGDACSLIEAFRSGERTPLEELDATLAAIEASDLNAFTYLDPEPARAAAKDADVSLPWGGLPLGIKELEPVKGWPWTEASLVFKDRIADWESTMTTRLRASGVVPVGLTAASEFGGLNVSVSRLNGVTHNPWRRGRTAGGSSGGSSSAVAGGLVTLATAGDGGGSIRIPAAYNGLLGMKGTYGRIPRGPHTRIAPNTVVLGCVARSVRDVARYYDVCAGYDPHDPDSLPEEQGWEQHLGSHDLAGKTVIVAPGLGTVPLAAGIEEAVEEAAEALIAGLGMKRIEADPFDIPRLGVPWAMGNLASLLVDLGDRWPKCSRDLTEELAFGFTLAWNVFDLELAAEAEKRRTEANTAMARLFEQADFVIAATNPDPAFLAERGLSSDGPGSKMLAQIEQSKAVKLAWRSLARLMRFAGAARPRTNRQVLTWASTRLSDLLDMGALTIPANIYGSPAVSIPVAPLDGLPIGMQVLGRHYQDALLLDLALSVERERPWPLTAPGAPL
jgi:Asp-tRNA(Asn)/Glu-tRNA(Gln) amidotransferase A subunit family amidase